MSLLPNALGRNVKADVNACTTVILPVENNCRLSKVAILFVSFGHISQPHEEYFSSSLVGN